MISSEHPIYRHWASLHGIRQYSFRRRGDEGGIGDLTPFVYSRI